MDTLPARLRYYRGNHGLTQEQVGKICGGKSKASVNAWESDSKSANPSIDDLKRLAKRYGITVDELVGASDTASRPRTQGRVPLLTLEQASRKDALSIMTTAGFAERSISCPVSHSDKTYALEIKDSSMTAPHGPTYPPGRVIYCDAALANSAESGSRVVARLPSGRAVVRELVDDGSGPAWLRPLNTQYDRIDGPFDVVAVVIGSFVPE